MTSYSAAVVIASRKPPDKMSYLIWGTGIRRKAAPVVRAIESTLAKGLCVVSAIASEDANAIIWIRSTASATANFGEPIQKPMNSIACASTTPYLSSLVDKECQLGAVEQVSIIRKLCSIVPEIH